MTHKIYRACNKHTEVLKTSYTEHYLIPSLQCLTMWSKQQSRNRHFQSCGVQPIIFQCPHLWAPEKMSHNTNANKINRSWCFHLYHAKYYVWLMYSYAFSCGLEVDESCAKKYSFYRASTLQQNSNQTWFSYPMFFREWPIIYIIFQVIFFQFTKRQRVRKCMFSNENTGIKFLKVCGLTCHKRQKKNCDNPVWKHTDPKYSKVKEHSQHHWNLAENERKLWNFITTWTVWEVDDSLHL